MPSYPALVVLAVLVGLLYGPINPLANYAMQTRTPERLRGRVVGVMTSSAYAAGPVGYLLAGVLVERFGVRPAFLAMAGGLLVVALVSVPARSLRELDAPTGRPPGPVARRGPLPVCEGAAVPSPQPRPVD